MQYVCDCGMYLAKTSFAQYFMEDQLVETEVRTSSWCDRSRALAAFDLSVCYKYTRATVK